MKNNAKITKKNFSGQHDTGRKNEKLPVFS